MSELLKRSGVLIPEVWMLNGRPNRQIQKKELSALRADYVLGK